MPPAPKPKAVNGAEVDPPMTRRCTRIRSTQLQTAPEPVSDAARLAMSSAPKQNAARKRGPWGEEYLLTNPKSVLAHADLVRLFSNPKAWECLDEDEKRELLSLLPADIHPNPDPDPEDPEAKIPPLPERFLRYDNNWRGALRHFQNDLETGRYKLEWQKQARQAAHERSQGKFDDFKEREFEQFWGQKQKINHGVIAGESSSVKLETLIQHDIVRVGDVWKYCRVFGTKKTSSTQTIVEKEAKITAIDGLKLSFLIPTGQRVFLSSFGGSVKSSTDEMEQEATDASQTKIDHDPQPQVDQQISPEVQDQLTNNELKTTFHLAGILDYAFEPKEDMETEIKADEVQTKEADSHKDQLTTQTMPVDSSTCLVNGHNGRLSKRKSPHDDNDTSETIVTEASADIDNNPPSLTEERTNLDLSSNLMSEKGKEPSELSLPATNKMEIDTPETSIPSSSQVEEPQQETRLTESATPLEIEVHNITGPSALTKKILEIDGRITNPPNGNSWKEFRCYRNNQDMGSLWEVRQTWYIKFQQE